MLSAAACCGLAAAKKPAAKHPAACARTCSIRQAPSTSAQKNKLWRRGLHLITSIRRNMRNYLMPLADKVMLRKRFAIETVLDTLKSEMGLEHSRHRSVVNAMVHVLSCLVAYAFRPGKPSISLTAQKITAYP